VAVLTNILKTVFTSTGAPDVVKDTEHLTRAQTRLGNTSAGTGRQFAAQASGLGGLVAAYAGAAATAFALQASFTALAQSARAAQTFEGLGVLASKSGEDATKLLASVQAITKSQLTLTAASEQINLALSAGFSGQQIEGLSGVALKASRALGRDLTDALTRVTRGSAKMETELLDELGIYTKIEPATAAYAAAIGKTRLELTEYERRQAFVNSVIAEGERKFSAINTVIPSTAEKIEAFGATVINLATQFGIFLADKLAPIADFLSNNLVAAFGAVGIAASLVASKGISILRDGLESLSAVARRKASEVEDYFLRFSKAAQSARDAAQSAVGGIALTKGISPTDQASLKKIKEDAKSRTLTGKELEQVNTILAKRKTNLDNLIKSETAEIAKLKELDTKLKATTSTLKGDSVALAKNTQDITANTKAIDAKTKALALSEARLKSNTAQQIAISSALKGTTSGVAKFASSTITGVIGLGTSLAHTAASFVGFGGQILMAISVLSLLGSALADLLGFRDKYNAFLETIGKTISNIFTTIDTKNAQKAFISLSDAALTSMQKTDKKLRDLDNFTFRSKVLGVDIEITKTKEDLIKEVSAALTTAATESNKTFGESLASTSGIVGTTVGAKIGMSLGAAAGAKFGAALGSAAAPGIGTAVGAILGTVAGAAAGVFTDQVILGLDEVDSTIKTSLQQKYGVDIFAGDTGAKLSKALQLIEEQAGAAKNLSIEGKIYYETQQKIAIQLAKNLDNFRELQTVASKLGTDAATIEKNFTATSDTLGNLVLTPKLAIPDAIEISVKIINEEKILADIEKITDLVEQARTVNELPERAKRAGASQAQQNIQNYKSNIRLLEQDIASKQEQLKNARETYATMQENPADYDSKALVNQATEVTKIAASYNSLNATLHETEAALRAVQVEYGLIDTTLTQEQSLAFDALSSSLQDYVQIQNDLSIANAKVAFSFNDIIESANSGSLSLEQLSQKEGVFQKLTDESNVKASKLREELDKQTTARKVLADSLKKSGLNTSEEAAQALAAIDAQIAANQESLVLTNLQILANKNNQEILQDTINPLREQLKLADSLQKTFGDLTQDKSKGFGTTDSSGRLLTNQEDIRKRQYVLLNQEISKSIDLYDKQQKQILEINAMQNLSIEQKQRLATVTVENLSSELENLGIQGDQAKAIEKLVTLTNEQAYAASNVSTMLTIQNNLYAEAKDKILDLSKTFKNNIAEAIKNINSNINELASQENIARIQFEIDMLDVQAKGQQAAFQFEKAFKENQIQLIELKVDNKKLEPTQGAEQINQLKTEIQAIQEAAIAAERAAIQERFYKENELRIADYNATYAKIKAEGEQLKAKFQAEYKLLSDVASVYSSISTQMSTAITNGGNAAGQAIVNAANTAAQTLGSALGPIGKLLGLGAKAAAGVFTPVQAPTQAASMISTPAGMIETDPVKLALKDAENSMITFGKVVDKATKEKLDMATQAYVREQQLAEANYAAMKADIARRTDLSAQERAIMNEENEKRLKEAKEAGGGGDAKLSEIDKKLQSLFDSIKGHIESALMGLNDLIFYGEGNFGDIMGNLFKSIQQDFFKQTVADPLSNMLTKTIFGSLGVSVTKGEKGLTFNASDNSLLVRVVNAAEIGLGGGGVLGSTDPNDPATTGIMGWMQNLLGKGGPLANMFTGLFGEDGILSGIINGFGSFLGSIFKAIFGGIFGGGFGGGKVTGGIMHMAQGGVAGSSALRRDRIPALLEPGEFVVRKPVARMVGTPALNALNATGRMPNGGAPVINMINEGSPKDVQQAKPRFDGEKYVIDIIMRDLNNNGPIRKSLRGGAI
jgi:hypothetical protein